MPKTSLPQKIRMKGPAVLRAPFQEFSRCGPPSAASRQGLLSAALRCGPPSAAIPVKTIIAMSANAFSEDVQQSLQAGMNAHLSKPVDIDRLLEALDKIASRKS